MNVLMEPIDLFLAGLGLRFWYGEVAACYDARQIDLVVAMLDLPFVSIIVPSRNRPSQLERCLQACARTTYPRERFEVIVVDDGSETSLESIAAPFQGRLDLTFIKQRNAGPAAARNAGAARARGAVLAFTDDDCLPDPEWVSSLARRSASAPVQMIGGHTVNALTMNLYAATSQTIVDVVYRHYNRDPDRARFFSSNNMAVPAEIFNELGGFNANFRFAEDRELCDHWLVSGFEMLYAPEAIVRHAHALTARSFWRQHFGYGRGAHQFQTHRARRQPGAVRRDMRFHADVRNWVAYPFTQLPGRQAVAIALLLVVWQVANAMGFVYEAMRQARRRPACVPRPTSTNPRG